MERVPITGGGSDPRGLSRVNEIIFESRRSENAVQDAAPGPLRKLGVIGFGDGQFAGVALFK